MGKNVTTKRLELKDVIGRKEFLLFVKNYFYGIKILCPITIVIYFF